MAKLSYSLGRPQIVLPIGNTGILNPINAKEDNVIDFEVNGGELVYFNEIEITEVSEENVTPVYQKKIQSYDFSHVIPRNTLTNGKSYNVRIRTYNNNDCYSEWSDIVQVMCFSEIFIAVNGITNGIVETQNPIFSATFTQAENEELYSYQYMLFKGQNLIENSGTKYDKTILHQFNHLENKTNYRLKLIITTKNRLQGVIEIPFVADYLQTKLNATMVLENNLEHGTVDITSYVKQVLGKITDGSEPIYINGEMVDIRNCILEYKDEDGFRIYKDFTMQLWCYLYSKSTTKPTVFMQWFTEKSRIELSYFKNVFFLKVYGTKEEIIYSIHDSVEFEINEETMLCVSVKYECQTGHYLLEVKKAKN